MVTVAPLRPLRRLVPGELDDRQRSLYDAIAGGPRAAGPQHFRLVDAQGALEGPFNAFLLRPEVGDPLQALGGAIRYATSFDDRAREIAILVVAATWRSDFEQHAHEAIGRAAGLTDAELAAVRAGGAADTRVEWPDPRDLVLVRVVRALAEDGDLDDDLYAVAVETFGEATLFELTTLVGYYATLALQLRVFRVPSPGSPADPTPTTQPFDH
jgi:4-carboxymuconolactone decarboxylase